MTTESNKGTPGKKGEYHEAGRHGFSSQPSSSNIDNLPTTSFYRIGTDTSITISPTQKKTTHRFAFCFRLFCSWEPVRAKDTLCLLVKAFLDTLIGVWEMLATKGA